MTDDYLDFLAGHVFDHDKLVTYKWLSKELQVHVNKAKQMLWEFYEKHRGNSDIDCTYLLMGTLNDGTTNGMRVEVVREADLSKAKEKFSKIISQHLYSVHKHLEDLELLAGPDTSGDVKYSAIKCDACVERTDEEMHLLRWRTSSMKITEEKVTNSKPVESTNNKKLDKPTAITKKNGFNNFFNTAGKQKSPEKLKTEKDQESEEKNSKVAASLDKDKGSKKKSPLEKRKSNTESSRKVSPKEEAKKAKKGGLDSFFGKMSSLPKPVKTPEKEVKTPEKREDQRSKEKAEKEAKEEAEKEAKEEAKKEVKEEVSGNKKVKEKEKPRGKKRVKSQGNDSVKRRKRIMVESDSSDSEEENNMDMDMDEPMPEAVIEVPTRPKSPSPPPVKRENGKRKVLKMMNETYKDDRGFIVTKKVHVYVSCSEDEEEEQERKKREKGPPPLSKKAQAKIDNTKKKQTTLMKFFKAS